MRPSTTPATALAPLAALVGLAMLTACSNDAPVDTASAAGPGAGRGAAARPDYTLVKETYLRGPGRWALPADGATRAPLAVFTVPLGYQGRDHYIWTHDEDGLADHPGQVLYRSPTRVVRDPCDPSVPSPGIGPSVRDLADALMLQQRTTTTRPVAVTLGGHEGLYLELTSDAGVDFEGCRRGGGMLLWETGFPEYARVFEFPSTERYWILDVQGYRVVVTAMTPSTATGSSVDRVTDVATSVTFVEPT